METLNPLIIPHPQSMPSVSLSPLSPIPTSHIHTCLFPHLLLLSYLIHTKEGQGRQEGTGRDGDDRDGTGTGTGTWTGVGLVCSPSTARLLISPCFPCHLLPSPFHSPPLLPSYHPLCLHFIPQPLPLCFCLPATPLPPLPPFLVCLCLPFFCLLPLCLLQFILPAIVVAD